jgi:hypothetical protein
VTVSPVFSNAAGPGGGSNRPSAIHIARAEELLGTLPGVVSVRIEASPSGDVDAIHVLTSVEIGPKQTVRNIESALLAHLGMRVDHRKISVATTVDAPRIRLTPASVDVITESPSITPLSSFSSGPASAPRMTPSASPAVAPVAAAAARAVASTPSSVQAVDGAVTGFRRYLFDDIEVKRSRSGLNCRVTLRRGDESFEGEAEGLETEAARLELAARATVLAIAFAENRAGAMALSGALRVDAFGTEFVFVGVSARQGRDSVLLSGSCAIRDSVETAGALAVLDATNRWLEVTR